MKIGVIGCGNMGGALVRGLATRAEHSLSVYDLDHSRVRATLQGAAASADAVDSARAAAAGAEVIVLAVKPDGILPLLDEIKDEIGPESLAVSVAAGLMLEPMELAAPGAAIARSMPNVGAALGAGTTGVVLGSHAVPERDEPRVRALFEAVGDARLVKAEDDLHAVTGLSGSGPAFVLTAVEAMIDAGVAAGLPREDAAFYARGAARAAAALLDGTQEQPAALRARITSPGGTTIAGVVAMEQAGGRAALQQAVAAAVRRSQQMSER